MYKNILDKIHEWENKYKAFSDSQLVEQTNILKEQLKKHSTFTVLPQAYALVGIASERVLSMKPYDVQYIGAISLAKGHIAQMRTGEGKTLVASMPSFLYALYGNGVHVVTVNDYLAKRDADEIGKIHQFLGLTVGVVLHSMTPEERKTAYNADITYVTNSELGFDYLRDNMVKNVKQRVLRGFYYCIIDEVDSILIDEARTPLILSGNEECSDEIYIACNELVSNLEKGCVSHEMDRAAYMLGIDIEEEGDYIVNEKEHLVYLTAEGIKKAEDYFGIKELNSDKHGGLYHAIIMALQAHTLMKKDKDYVVINQMVYIVDEFTGRIMDGRRFSNGLHQALEAKEQVPVQAQSKTYASVTYQHFFSKYQKICGMTGTAWSDRKEFNSTYKLHVDKIPTNKPVIRKDESDVIVPTLQDKYQFIAEEVEKAYLKTQPVLVGTSDIRTSILISEKLAEKNIPHNVLHAKNHEKEAEIVAEAGKAGSVTIATNMAGRGTDIKLDSQAKEMGGLLVIGTEHFDSKRVDDQLRGRSGRQGDPGRSFFCVSLEDKLYELQKELFPLDINKPACRANKNKMEKIQSLTGLDHFGQRKHILDYGTVDNMQREMFYEQRRYVLENGISDADIKKMLHISAINICSVTNSEGVDVTIKKLKSWLNVANVPFDIKGKNRNYIEKEIHKLYEKKCRQIGETASDVFTQDCLTCMDWKWVEHMVKLHQLLPICQIQSLGQKDSRAIYKKDAFTLYEKMMTEIAFMTLGNFFRHKVKTGFSISKKDIIQI